MAYATDEKLHEELLKNGYTQSTSNPNYYSQPDGTGGYNYVDTDGRDVKKSGTDNWRKFN